VPLIIGMPIVVDADDDGLRWPRARGGSRSEASLGRDLAVNKSGSDCAAGSVAYAGVGQDE
jgi:hypothetical protein